MAELTKAEIMLNQVTKSNSLIRQLELCKNRPIPPLRLDLRPSTKSTIKAFQENVQGRIDQLSGKRFWPLWSRYRMEKPGLSCSCAMAFWTMLQRKHRGLIYRP